MIQEIPAAPDFAPDLYIQGIGKKRAVQQTQEVRQITLLQQGFRFPALFITDSVLMEHIFGLPCLFCRNGDDFRKHIPIEPTRFGQHLVRILAALADDIHAVDDGNDVIGILFVFLAETAQFHVIAGTGDLITRQDPYDPVGLGKIFFRTGDNHIIQFLPEARRIDKTVMAQDITVPRRPGRFDDRRLVELVFAQLPLLFFQYLERHCFLLELPQLLTDGPFRILPLLLFLFNERPGFVPGHPLLGPVLERKRTRRIGFVMEYIDFPRLRQGILCRRLLSQQGIDQRRFPVLAASHDEEHEILVQPFRQLTDSRTRFLYCLDIIVKAHRPSPARFMDGLQFRCDFVEMGQHLTLDVLTDALIVPVFHIIVERLHRGECFV